MLNINLIFVSRLVISRLETNVLRVLNPYLSSAKDEKVKENLIKAVSLFGKAVQQSCRTGEFVFSKKSELLKYIEVFDKIRSKKGDWLSVTKSFMFLQSLDRL